MAVNHSLARNILLGLTLCVTAGFYLALTTIQTRQARYQCENLIFQRHAQMVHSAESTLAEDHQMPPYNQRMAEAWQEWRMGIQACHDHNQELLP